MLKKREKQNNFLKDTEVIPSAQTEIIEESEHLEIAHKHKLVCTSRSYYGFDNE